MNVNASYTYGKLNTNQLKVDRSYQRDLDTARVKRIADHFNPLKVNPAKVSHRDGAYWIFDGQHTTKVLIMNNGGKDLFIECKIYEGLTQQDEAELFARQTEGTRKVEKNSEMKALYTAHDVEIIELKKAVEDAGFILDFTKGQAPNKIVCYSRIYNIFTKARPEDFQRFLHVIKESWHGEPESLRREIIGGMWVLIDTYKEQFNYDMAVKKFQYLSPAEVIRNGKLLKNISGDGKYSYILADNYNKKLRGNKLDLMKLM